MRRGRCPGLTRCLRAWLGAGVMALLGCSASRAPAPSRPSLLEAEADGRRGGGAEWRYHPRRAAGLERAYSLPDERQLLVGGAGERWLVQPGSRRARAAAMLAPEPLIGAVPSSAGWSFIGRSGAAYAAASPLAPFSAASAPPVEMAQVDAGDHHLLGVSRGGALWLSDDAGSDWRRVGPDGATFADVLLSGAHGLALQLPERLWVSDDEGLSWRALAEPAFGARGLARDEEAGPVVLSVLGARAVSGGEPKLLPLGRVFRPVEPTLDGLPELGPSARALGQGRAVDVGGRYFELVLGVNAEVLSGPSFGQLERRRAPELAACSDASVAGFERWIYVACTRERSGSARQLELWRSDDGGASFEREPYAARGDPELLRLAVGRGGTLLATGLCAPGESVPGCRPRGIVRRQPLAGDAGASVALLPVAAPALEEHARALAFSADGSVAYAVGTRTKSDSPFVFVASDLARGFSARPLGALDERGARTSSVVSFAASEQGPLSLVLRDGSGSERLLVLDADGRTLSLNAAPADAAVIGAHGDRALAVSPEGVWESSNGGAEWHGVGRLPRSICAPSAGRCVVRVHCSAGGCVIGDSLSRRGWRAHADLAPLGLPARPRPPIASGRALGVGHACELSSTEWAELRGVDRLPDAAQAALGKAAWFALASDDASASAGLFIAEGARAADERAASVRYSELLERTPQAADFAYHVSLQVEGGAALRFRMPESVGKARGSITRLEVAWENLFEGQRRRALIADAGPLLPGDVVKSEGLARRAQPDLISIASGGVFVRPHRQPQHDQPSWFLDGTHVEQLPPLPWSFGPAKETSFEMARLGGEGVHLAFVDRGATVVRARRSDGAWRFDAMTIGYPEPDRFSVEQRRDIAYSGARAGLVLTQRHADGSALGLMFPLQATGPALGAPRAVPTQRDLGEALVACTPQQRAATARVLAPWHPGRRRPIVVHDAVEPRRIFLTDQAVLHGTPESPCVAAVDAELVRTGASARERALLFLDGPSWLFRLAVDSARREARVEYRSMRCRPDPSPELPPEVYELPGTERLD